MEHLMDEGDGDRAFADSGRDALDAAAPNVAHCEHSGQTRFQQMRRPDQRPARRGQLFLCQVWPRLDEAVRIERETALEPACTWNRASHDKDVFDVVPSDL